MELFYLLAVIPVVIGGVIWVLDKAVNWWEWAIGSGVAFILAVIFHIIAIHGMTGDTETWSGQITDARHYSRWEEYYEYAVYRTEIYYETVTSTDSEGHTTSHEEMRTREVFDHWEPTSQWHDDSWDANSDIGTHYDIDSVKYAYFVAKYQNESATPGERTTMEHNSRMISGDPNDYVVDNSKTHWIEPITVTKTFQNKIKAAPSVFSFIKVPTNIAVYPWPANPDHWQSDRVLGTAKQYIATLHWDQLNAVLGPKKKVNLIVIGFDSDDTMLGQYQRAKYVGGKKNDLVICVGGPNLLHPHWCFVFGWSDSEIVKQDIQSWVMEHGIEQASFLQYLENEITNNYQKKQWHDFDYLKVEPRPVFYVWYIILMVVTQTGLYLWFNYNDIGKSYGEQSLFDGSRTGLHIKGGCCHHTQRMGQRSAFVQSLSRLYSAFGNWIRQQISRLQQVWRNIVNALSR